MLGLGQTVIDVVASARYFKCWSPEWLAALKHAFDIGDRPTLTLGIGEVGPFVHGGVDRSTLKIVGRAISTLIGTQGTGDLYQLYVLAQRDHIDFNATWIPPTFTEKISQPFDTTYMNKLYRVGRAAIENGTAWSKYPPGYSPTPFTGHTSPG